MFDVRIFELKLGPRESTTAPTELMRARSEAAVLHRENTQNSEISGGSPEPIPELRRPQSTYELERRVSFLNTQPGVEQKFWKNSRV